MAKILLLVLGLSLLPGCYTQLLTRSDLTGVNVAPPQVPDSGGANESAVTRTPNAVSAPVQQGLNDCNCTPFAINNGLCWCLCDRCGTYPRLGYEYCPRGIYNSYWGWDYYQEYPWWHNDYYRGRGRGQYGDEGYHPNYGGGGASSGNTVNTIYLDKQRKKNRGEIESGSGNAPLRKEGVNAEPPASPPPAPVYQQPSGGSSSTITVNPAPSDGQDNDKANTVVPTGQERKKKRGEIE
jgi:hypothetical protein